MKCLFCFISLFIGSVLFAQPYPDSRVLTEKDLKTGASQTSKYIPLLKGKRVAVIANTTSTIFGTHLVDTLLSLKVNIKKIFCPEHGFRGVADAGEKVKTETDPKTGLPVISLYGKHMKPLKEELTDVDVLVYDLQD